MEIVRFLGFFFVSHDFRVVFSSDPGRVGNVRFPPYFHGTSFSNPSLGAGRFVLTIGVLFLMTLPRPFVSGVHPSSVIPLTRLPHEFIGLYSLDLQI